MDFAVISVIWIHFFADFILQADEVAQKKSSDNSYLALHAAYYMIPFMFLGTSFAMISGALHFVVDWATSRWCAKLYREEKRHWFFVVVGLDQAIHLTCLIFTLHLCRYWELVPSWWSL